MLEVDLDLCVVPTGMIEMRQLLVLNLDSHHMVGYYREPV